MKKATLFFLFCIHLLMLAAQTFPYEKYTSKNGLISDRITAIAQDESGFIWFGSFFGICRYDGRKFEKMELPAQQRNKYVNYLLAANGKMYAGFLFGGGLAEYDHGEVNAYFIAGKDSATANEFTCMHNFRWPLAHIRCESGKFTLLQANYPGRIHPLFHWQTWIGY